MWVILPNNADWDCFKILTSREILKIRNPLLEEPCASLGSHTFVPISWMCKKQTAVSHSSTESEIISLDTGLRLGLSAPVNDVKKHQKSQWRINVIENVDFVSSNVQSSRQEALLYVFEDNEAVIKMIVKRRSRTMTHISRTRVALDWLFDRINLDPNPNQTHRHQKPTR